MHVRNAVVTQEHKSNYPNPVVFEPGDQLELGAEDTEFPGWVRISDSVGNEGWAPLEYIKLSENHSTGVALKAYSAKELDVEPGDRLIVKHEHCQWCWVEHAENGAGWVPEECLKAAN